MNQVEESKRSRVNRLRVYNPYSSLIHSILIGGQSMSLRDNRGETKDYITFDYINLKKELDGFLFAKKIVIEPYMGVEDIPVKIMIRLVNYFAGKDYRVTRMVGHGEEQLQFIRRNVKKELS